MNAKLNKKIGMWLDHSQAHFIDVTKGEAILETAFAGASPHEHIKGETGTGTKLSLTRATNNEHHMHNAERNVKSEYYRMLADRLKLYDDIYLFGPTSAKDELYNILAADKYFNTKVIRVEACDKLTENQMVAKVKSFFNL